MLTLGVWILGIGVWFVGFTLLPWAVNEADKIKLDKDDEDGNTKTDS